MLRTINNMYVYTECIYLKNEKTFTRYSKFNFYIGIYIKYFKF